MERSSRSTGTLNRLAKCEDCDERIQNADTVCPECGSENVDYDWNTLKNAYAKHDVGEAYFTGRMHQIGLQVEHWGIDMREDDESLVFDDKMDLRLWEPYTDVFPSQWPSDDPDAPRIPSEWYCGEYQGILRGVVDIKTKANEDWLCAFNVRHFAHYAHWAQRYDVPTFLYFTLVDMDAESVGEQNILVSVETDWNHHLVADHFDSDSDVRLSWSELKAEVSHSSMVDRVSRAPDGNPVVWVDESAYEDFDWFISEVL